MSLSATHSSQCSRDLAAAARICRTRTLEAISGRLTSLTDDGIVVFLLVLVPMPPRKSSIQTPTTRSHAIREAFRRIAAIELRLARRAPAKVHELESDTDLRWRILEEVRLRRGVLRDKAFRKEHPAEWKSEEMRRLARNRETAAVNQRLRAAGLRPVELEPSLEQRMRKLRRLESSNRAKTATRRGAR